MQQRLPQLLQLLVATVIPVATVLLFATLTIYSGNAREFASSYGVLARALFPYAAMLIAALFVLGLVLSSNGRKRYLALLSALAILFWLQGNILVWRYGVFDGSAIDWLDGAWRGILDLLLWVAVLLLAIYGFRRFGKALFAAAAATLLIQVIASVTSIGRLPENLAPNNAASNVDGRAAAMQFSADFNVVQIVMDGFQSDIFASILADSTGRDFRSELQGFTYFDKHLGAYPYTQLTLPAMLGGKLFRNEMRVEDFVSKTITGPTITNSAYDAGFEVDFVAPIALKNVYALGRHSNAYGTTTNAHVTEDDIVVMDAARLVDLALFRVLPHFAKALVHRDQLWIFQAKVQSRDYLHLQYFSDLAFLEDLAEEMAVVREAPVYKLIHVMLSHRPFVGNARCEFDGRQPETREAVTVHARCGLLRVFAVLQRMKDLGIYDSSLVVLMADHGAWIPVENFASAADVGALTAAMATPMLAIKLPGAMHEFRVSSAPSAMTDIAATIADVANIDGDFPGQSVFALEDSVGRERIHLTYGYGYNPGAKGFLFPMQEWLVSGDPYLAESWQQGMRYYPAGANNQ
jgi:hypothetical protein